MQSSAPEVLVFKTHAGEESPESKYFAVGTYLAAIPHLERYDATLIVPGVDFGPQLESGWREWGRHSRNVIVVGHNDAMIGEKVLAAPALLAEYGQRPGKIISQGLTQNTATQAAWAAKCLKDWAVRTVSIHVHEFHAVRFVLTLLAALKVLGHKVVLRVIYPPANPFEAELYNPPTGKWELRSVDCVHGETPRMMQYQAKGDVLSNDEFYQWLFWLYGQPEIVPLLIKRRVDVRNLALPPS
jgi:hypothetical protein